jgi:hypothetical protein
MTDFYKDEYQMGEAEEKLSPSGKYRLVITRYDTSKVTGENTWAHTRGRLYHVTDGTLIADIKRNYSQFNHSFQMKNEQEYLITGRDYMGQTIVNCDEGWEASTPETSGEQFCWVDHWLSPDGKTLVVDGCYWACPFELFFFDFSNPRRLPLPELEFNRSWQDSYELSGSDSKWRGDKFYAEAECERRKLDGKPHAGKWTNGLTEEEMEEVRRFAEQAGENIDDYTEDVKDLKVVFRREGNRIIREVIS